MKNSMKRFRMLGVLLAAGMILSARAQQPSATAEELTGKADLVLVGKVAGVKAAWTNDRSRIVTTVTLAVDQALKGTGLPGTVTIESPGGEIGGVGEWYSHTAQFKKDEDVVVFVKKDREGRLHVSGGTRGKLTIRRDEQTGTKMVTDGVTLERFSDRVKQAVRVETN
jgi:hypothetical protein